MPYSCTPLILSLQADVQRYAKKHISVIHVIWQIFRTFATLKSTFNELLANRPNKEEITPRRIYNNTETPL